MEITFEQGDITKGPAVDALVHPTSTDLRIVAGLGATLRSAGGAEFVEGARSLAPLALGAVGVGPGGSLRAPRVLHAAVVSYELDDLSGPREDGALIHGTVLRRAMHEILATAARLELQSLAVPDLTGPSAFPLELGARIVLSELHALVTEGGATTLERVRFVLALEDEREAYQAAWEALLDVHSTLPARTSAPPAPADDPFAAECVAFKPRPQ